MKKVLFLAVLMGLSSIVNASELSCSLLEDGIVVAEESQSSDGSGQVDINPITRDVYTFGAAYLPSESGMEALILWSSWEDKKSQHRELDGSLEEVTADGKVLRLECDAK
ncbi:MAG: hypothetical protein K2Q18_18580 [Bdellovibrionales bacterium]|nr:hypothetical protein [Bdellovibrionales bacterium]